MNLVKLGHLKIEYQQGKAFKLNIDDGFQVIIYFEFT
jgi:hypothetical protein